MDGRVKNNEESVLSVGWIYVMNEVLDCEFKNTLEAMKKENDGSVCEVSSG
jgi:hypothetical protein